MRSSGIEAMPLPRRSSTSSPVIDSVVYGDGPIAQILSLTEDGLLFSLPPAPAHALAMLALGAPERLPPLRALVRAALTEIDPHHRVRLHVSPSAHEALRASHGDGDLVRFDDIQVDLERTEKIVACLEGLHFEFRTLRQPFGLRPRNMAHVNHDITGPSQRRPPLSPSSRRASARARRASRARCPPRAARSRSRARCPPTRCSMPPHGRATTSRCACITTRR